jgi:S-adenosylmethionine hydrolase
VYIGPHNALFTPELDDPRWEANELRATELWRPRVSRTFHGRDVFAPVAAHLATGTPLGRLGPRVLDPVRLPWAEVRRPAGALVGAVVHVDRFGNLVTSIHAEALKGWGTSARIRVAGRRLPLVETYGDLAPGRAGALVGSRDRLEIAVREGSAAARFQAGRGTPILVTGPAVSRTTRTRTTRTRR